MSNQHSSGCCSSDESHNHQGHGHDHSHEHGVFDLRRELIPLSIAVVLFLIGLIFNQPLHDTPGAIAEYAILIPAYLISGWTVLTSAGRNILRGKIRNENFLMTIATLGAIAIHELPEGVAVMLFFQIGELFQAFAVKRSHRSIKSLIETADVVLMNDAPSKVAEAIEIGRKTHSIVWQNIILAMVVKAVFILLGAVGIASLWSAVFADVGVALLAILNATRVLRVS